MSHSVNTAHEFHPLAGPRNTHPVLTIGRGDNYGGRQISFYRDVDDALVVHPWGVDGKAVTLIGEDLFALRIFLEEFPEESFVAPHPAVETFLHAFDHDGDVWGFNDKTGHWEPVVVDGDFDTRDWRTAGEEAWETAFFIAPERESRWTDGDQVLEARPEKRENSWLWERRDGEWVNIRVTGEAFAGHPITDETMNDFVGRPVNDGDVFYIIREQGAE